MTERSDLSRLVRAGLLTAVTDGLFSSVLSAYFYHSTVTRLWQGVASVLFGPGAIGGGNGMVVAGLVMHLTVAFTWSTIYLLMVSRWRWVRNLLASPGGVIKVAALYGPFIWLAMSLVVIPVMVHRPPNITFRWLVQLIGHFPLVALPMVAMISAGRREPPAA